MNRLTDVISALEVFVIIPAYNNEGSLGLSIDSALSQDPISVEVIVVNDGSTDSTAAVAGSYGDRIRYVEQENQGAGAARNWRPACYLVRMRERLKAVYFKKLYGLSSGS